MTALLCGRSASAAVENVRLAPATPGAIRFTVQIPSAGLAALASPAGTQRLTLEGFESTGEPGAPALPERIVAVAVPPEGDVSVAAAASDLRAFDGVTLEPAPGRAGDDGLVIPTPRASAYAAQGSPTPGAARLLDVSWMRNQRIARIVVQPAAYQPALRRLTLASRIDVEVRITPAAPTVEPDEPNDPFEGVYRSTLVNYQQGRSWRRGRTAAASASRSLLRPAFVTALALPPDTSVFVGRGWVKIAIQKTGFYVLNYSRVSQLSLFSGVDVPFDSLRMFSWPGPSVMPERDYCDTCDYREVAIGVLRDVRDTDSSPDGHFSSNNDAIYFYAQGPDGWENDFDSTAPDTAFLTHPYDRFSYYYLTFGYPAVGTSPATPVAHGDPQRIADARFAGTSRSVDPTATVGAIRATVPGRRHLEQDLEYWPDAAGLRPGHRWEKWFWRSMTPGTPFQVPFDIPDLDPTQAARFRLVDWGLTNNELDISKQCGGSRGDHLLDVTVNTVAFPEREWYGYVDVEGAMQSFDTTGTFLQPQGNVVNLFVPVISPPSDCPFRVDRSALAFFDVFYQRKLLPQADAIEFRTASETGSFRYQVGPFTSAIPPRLFDVTDSFRPVELTGFTFGDSGAGNMLTFVDTQSGSQRYAVVPDTVLDKNLGLVSQGAVSDAPATSYLNLRDTTRASDYIVIYFDGFQQAAAALTDWRRTHLSDLGRPAPIAADSIPVSALYDQFSGGRTDPAAIRNFLRQAFRWRRRPAFVTLLGDASYDFKNITGRAPAGQPGCLLPTYDNGFDSSTFVRREFASDNWMLNVNDIRGGVPDYFGGRVPADDPASALDFVRQKLIGYEASAPLGEYRNQIMLVADDFLQGENCDDLGWTHVSQTSDLDTTATPRHFDRDYVYLHTYPEGPGNTKPGARADVKKFFNDGISIFNYVGHGSPFKIADESVFLDTDAGTLTNGLKLPLFISASCDVGKFNDPTVQSLGERLVMQPSGGSIAVVSATELAFSSLNSQLNRALYLQLFQRDTVTVQDSLAALPWILTMPGAGQYHVPISAALLAAKYASGSSGVNDSKYQVLGDAASQLRLPQLWTDLSLTDSVGAAVSEVARGRTLVLHGRVLDRPGGTLVPFDGVASLLVEDSAPYDNTGTVPACPQTSVPEFYFFKAGAIFHGDVSVTGGVFSIPFVVPLDASTGAYGRVRAYLSGRPTGASVDADGAGSITTQVSPGSAPAGDVSGPRITLDFVGGSTNVRGDAVLRINLFDESGIMTTGHAPQNEILVTVDDNSTSRSDVTSSFRYAANSYQSGTATFTLPDLPPGDHSVKVSAADNLASGITATQHRSSASIAFTVVSAPQLRIARTYLFPNPARSGGGNSGGVFVVDAPGDSINTLLRIYTISGRLIRTLKQFGGIGQVQIPWDGLDAEGDRLAQGTYLYKVYVNGREADGSSSARQREATEGRFVILSP